MSGQFLILSVFLCSVTFFELGCATVDPEIRNSSMKILEENKKITQRAIDTCTQYDILNRITDCRMDYGNVLSERSHYEMEMMAAGSILSASLLKVSKDVIKCMNDKKVEAQKENEGYHLDHFHLHLMDTQCVWSTEEMDAMFDWYWVKESHCDNYYKNHENAVKIVQTTDNETEITEAVKKVNMESDILVKNAREYLDKVRKIQRGYLKYADEAVNKLRDFVRNKVDRLYEALQDCYFVNSPYYKLKNIFFYRSQ